MRPFQTTICSIEPSGSSKVHLKTALFLFVSFYYFTAFPHSEENFRSSRVELTNTRPAGFTLLPPSVTGVQFKNYLPESRHLTNGILLNGAGVALGDVDGDGLCDIYLCRSEGSNALYRNLGNWRFADFTEAAQVGCAKLTSTGAVLADLDGDGDLDLAVNTVGNGTRVFLNDGKGHFQLAWTLNPRVAGMTLAVADVDGDGFLDLYIANHRTSALMDIPNARFTFHTVDGKSEIETVKGRPVTDPDLKDRFVQDGQGGIKELGETDLFLRNQGGTNWVAVPFTSGAFEDEKGVPLAAAPRGWALTAAFHDVNGDGLPDLYVCHDFQVEDEFWINQGGGKFRRIDPLAQRKLPMSSMAVDFGDINGDGAVDFLTLDMMSRSHRERMLFFKERPPVVHTPGLILNRPQYEMNTLFLNRGDTTFAEIAQLSGLEATEWAWSCLFTDVDLDGWQDVLIVNGMERAGRDLDVAEQIKKLRTTRRLSDAEVYESRRMYPRQATANLAFRNRGDLTFEEVGGAWGFAWKGVSSSMAQADLDNDGDLDVVVNNLNDYAGIFRNETTAPRIAVRLAGLPPNSRGIGARIRVQGGAVPLQSQEMTSGGRYLSGDDSVRCFAAGSVTNRLRIEVIWRNGRLSTLENLEPNRIYEIDEKQAVEAAKPPPSQPAPPWFQDVSASIEHTHHQETFDDFSRQPLLPNRLSQLGPGITWLDLDGDGHEDLIVGAGRGGRLGCFRGDGRGGFAAASNPGFTALLQQDSTTVLGWNVASGAPSLLVGLANYPEGPGTGVAVQTQEPEVQKPGVVLEKVESSTGPMALADLDGEGHWRLLVGGRVIGGKYPAVATSRLLAWKEGRWTLDEENSKALQDIGLVSGALFCDLNGDGLPELVLACEWGPIRIFQNEKGRLTEVTGKLGMTNYVGWWNSVAAGDFDGDGRIDLAASNWGRNTKYEAHRQRPLQLYYGDFLGDGSVETIEAHWEPQLQKNVPERQLNPLANALPFLRERFSSHRTFGAAGMEDILGPRLAQAKLLTANWLESTVFLNRGDHFEARTLPVQAQMSPAFGICVGDADGDGREDLFLAQNFFDAQPETARYDAGRGLWLRGDGQGGFIAVDGAVSGVRIYGEQRGAALADFDEDGRVDLAVGQNGGPTKLYRNAAAKPGIRVRLKGPASNPRGIGAAIALSFQGRKGPVREIHAGSGYWSQDSAVQVLGDPEQQATGVWVRWPGGRTVEVPVEAKERPTQITIAY